MLFRTENEICDFWFFSFTKITGSQLKKVKKVNLWPLNIDWNIENKENNKCDEFVLLLLFILNEKTELLTAKICIVLIKNDIGDE